MKLYRVTLDVLVEADDEKQARKLILETAMEEFIAPSIVDVELLKDEGGPT